MTGGSDRTGRNGQCTIQKQGVGNPPDMPELEQNAPAGIVNSPRDQFPALDLEWGPDTGGVGVTDSGWRDRCGFRNDQARRSALRVILGHQSVWYSRGTGPGTGERSHDNTVGQMECTDLDGIKKSGMIHGLSGRSTYDSKLRSQGGAAALWMQATRRGAAAWFCKFGILD